MIKSLCKVQLAYDYLTNKDDTIPYLPAYADMPDELEKIVDDIKYSMNVYRYDNLDMYGGQSNIIEAHSLNNGVAEMEWTDYGWKVKFRAELTKF